MVGIHATHAKTHLAWRQVPCVVGAAAAAAAFLRLQLDEAGEREGGLVTATRAAITLLHSLLCSAARSRWPESERHFTSNDPILSSGKEERRRKRRRRPQRRTQQSQPPEQFQPNCAFHCLLSSVALLLASQCDNCILNL